MVAFQIDSVDLTLGFLAGLVASLLAWYVVTLYFTPRLNISTLNRLRQPPEISPCGFRYRVKLQNASRRYAIADISMHGRLVIRGLDPLRPHVQTSMLMPVAEVAIFPVLDARTKNGPPEDYERVYTLRIHETQGAALRRLPDEIRSGLEDRTVPLERLLELGSDAFIRFAVSSSHARSGYRRTYSRRFRLADIREGEFDEPGVTVRG